MKVILNSDIVYQEQLMRALPRGIIRLATRVKELRHEIVLPTTAILEFERKQREAASVARRELSAALSRLDEFGIGHDAPMLDRFVEIPNLQDLLWAIGVLVVVEEPSYNDLIEAHRRACLHEAPRPPESKSDEMRDLVIWMIALRLARDGEGALLISRDHVHAGPLGDQEADGASLVRVKSVDEALEYFDVLSPSGEVIKGLLAPAWRDLLTAGLPASDPMLLRSISDVRFRQGTHGLASAECILKARAPQNRILSATVRVDVDERIVKRVKVSDVMVEGKAERDVEITLNVLVDLPVEDFGEDLEALQAIIEGDET